MLPPIAITPERIKHFWLLLILLPALVQAERLGSLQSRQTLKEDLRA